MIGQERGSPASKPPPGASPAAAGLSATRGRFSRTRRKHSNGSVQSSSSSGTGQSVESIGTRQPSKIRIRRQQQRLSAVFGRGETNADTAAVTDDPSELSNHITAPGILKIFGTEICEGANYKSVLATTHSSARELVKEALARYSVSKADAGEYVLCDVIGCVVNHSWRTECVRALGENEKPLLLQSLWKPREGFARRFEIQHKATLEEQHSRDEDTLTAGINAQARKLQKTRSRGKSVCVRDDNMLNLFKSLSETDLNSSTHTCTNHTHTPEAENLNTCTHTCTNHTHIPETRCVDGEREETESSDDNCTQYCIHPPTHCPYLLLLQGYSHRQDLLLYALVSSCTVFGHHVNLSDTETEVNAVRLGDPDLLDRHCSIRRKDINTGPSLLKPLSGAAVQRNGAAVQDEVELRSGDFISIGEHYLLMFKDPTAPDAPLTTHTRPVLQQVCVECVCPHSFRNLQGEDLELVYDLQDEHTLLEEIFRLAEELHTHTRAHTHKLSVAFLLCVCVQRSVMHFFTADLRRLLLRVADRIQTSVWEKAKELAALQPENDRELLVALEPMLFWMSSSLQLLYFVQQEVPRLHKQKQDFTPAHSDVLELRLAIEETLSVLEEVFMFSFQQCVYYITKVLYTLLPAVLDSHAFSASGCVSMQRVLEVLMQTLQMLREHHLHPDVRSQLFSYLFYFSNTLLFNLLMERGSGGGFFCWSRGVQIRANLDLLLDWTEASGLSDLAQHFLLKLSSAVNLLATPRETLLQMSWSALRLEYPALNAAQLQHLLSQYEPQRRCKHTCCWTPPTDKESCAAHTTAELLECFDAPPPLVLPGDGFPLQLNRAVTDLSLIQSLQLLQKRIQNSAEPESAAVHTHTPTVMEAKRTKLKVHPKAHLEPSGHTQLQFPPDLDSCGDLLTQTLQNLELQDKDGSVPALDSSCLLTPPNTPRQTEDDAEQGECDEAAAGDDEDEDVFVLELQRAACGLGLLLVDGEETAGLGVSGIFIKSVLPDSPAALSERLKTGDRILAVNGKSLSGVDYQTGMDLIQTSGERPRLLVSRSHRIIRKTPANSLCDLGD